MKFKEMYKDYNFLYRLRLINLSLSVYILGYLVAKDLTTNGYLVFLSCFVIAVIFQIKLVRLEKYIPK